MASAREIKHHISSIRDTQKITNAMYMISSTKLRRAKTELDRTRPYFTALQNEIKRIFRTVPGVNSKYFYPPEGAAALDGTYGCLVITADKGLAGAYNHNVLKAAENLLHRHGDTKLFVVGDFGRQYFTQRGIQIEESFLYPAQNPTMDRAREICTKLLERFDSGEFDKIYIIYTDFKNGMYAEPVETRLLPFHRGDFSEGETNKSGGKFEFIPSVEAVLDNIIPSYVSGFIYSALIDSFCSEQNARMTAMNSAGDNADKLLAELSVEYNRVRQAAITQEITEIAAGAKAQRAKNSESGKEAFAE